MIIPSVFLLFLLICGTEGIVKINKLQYSYISSIHSPCGLRSWWEGKRKLNPPSWLSLPFVSRRPGTMEGRVVGLRRRDEPHLSYMKKGMSYPSHRARPSSVAPWLPLPPRASPGSWWEGRESPTWDLETLPLHLPSFPSHSVPFTRRSSSLNPLQPKGPKEPRVEGWNRRHE